MSMVRRRELDGNEVSEDEPAHQQAHAIQEDEEAEHLPNIDALVAAPSAAATYDPETHRDLINHYLAAVRRAA